MLAITSADFNERVLQAELNAHADCLLQQVAAVKKYPVFGQTLIKLASLEARHTYPLLGVNPILPSLRVDTLLLDYWNRDTMANTNREEGT
jgi:hypothetical protein